MINLRKAKVIKVRAKVRKRKVREKAKAKTRAKAKVKVPMVEAKEMANLMEKAREMAKETPAVEGEAEVVDADVDAAEADLGVTRNTSHRLPRKKESSDKRRIVHWTDGTGLSRAGVRTRSERIVFRLAPRCT